MPEEVIKLTEKQRLFVDEYIRTLNITKAAIAAGYSPTSARVIGSDTLRKPYIRDYINKILEANTLSAEETLKVMSDIGRGDLKPYMSIETVVHVPKVKMGLAECIEALKKEILFEEEVEMLVGVPEDRKEAHNAAMASRRERVVRMELELRDNPNAYRIVDGPEELREIAVVDAVKLAKADGGPPIKSLSNGEYGLKVETYSADKALENLAKIHGKFEKDNAQRPAAFSPEQASKLDAILHKLK